MTGETSPSRGQLTKMAETLARPRSLFLLPEPPVSLNLPTTFRHPVGDKAATVPANVRLHIRSARRIQRAVGWALADAAPIDLPPRSSKQPSEEVADALRAWVGISVEEQVSWTSEYRALNAWRAALEDRGLLTFQFEMRGQSIRGFSAWDAHAPMIAVNSHNQTPQARIFTFAHELAHLATRTDAACLDWVAPRERGSRSLEGWCDAVAAQFLMPAEDVRKFARSTLGVVEPKTGGLPAGRRLSHRYRVSLGASVLRLIELDLAPRSLYGEAAALARNVRRKAASGGASEPRPAKRVRQYGRRATKSLLEATSTGRVSERDAADMLAVDYRELSAIAAALSTAVE
ncbi:MAG: hypothetical protein QOI82_2951 [Actinomycetota bacterium]|jgi:Zn-dependent peptidase ImmA (M78 family)|nr:hypothetical protein [Actinomycetota bacterium]